MQALDRLTQIFNCQITLMDRFHPVEAMNNAAPMVAIHERELVTRGVQRHLKELGWRAVEELMEARWAYDDTSQDNFFGELVDAYHFIVELTISSAMTAPDLVTNITGQAMLPNMEPDGLDTLFNEATAAIPEKEVDERFLDVVDTLAQALYQLKNNPWKTTMRAVDTVQYYTALGSLHMEFAALCDSVGLTPEELHRRYVEKHHINLQRQKDGR